MRTTKNVRFLTQAAMIAALYAVLTYAAAAVNLAYGAVQFRFSEGPDRAAGCSPPPPFPAWRWAAF